MEKNEIKKALYRQKPIAVKTGEKFGKEFGKVESFLYETTIVNPSVTDDVPTVKLKFEVPINDMGDATFKEEIKAQLLIRYLKN
jgi:hypothetical protein